MKRLVARGSFVSDDRRYFEVFMYLVEGKSQAKRHCSWRPGR